MTCKCAMPTITSMTYEVLESAFRKGTYGRMIPDSRNYRYSCSEDGAFIDVEIELGKPKIVMEKVGFFRVKDVSGVWNEGGAVTIASRDGSHVVVRICNKGGDPDGQ